MIVLFSRFLVLLTLLVLASCDKTVDNAVPCRLPTGETTCTYDSQCGDGSWCSGEERCEPGNPAASACGCVRKANTAPCGDDSNCHDEILMCILKICEGEGASADADGDGHGRSECGGDDCDDTDPGRFPGNPEVCDFENLDEDCDDTTFGVRDADGDGFVDVACCNHKPGGYDWCGPDCDDNRPGVNPIAPEVCNGLDDDCDAVVDEAVSVPLYADADTDGFGAGEAALLCAGTPGYSSLGNDCDDATPSLFPGMLRCTSKGGGEYEYCESSGEWSAPAYCPNQAPCVEQPGGWGVCIYYPQ